MHFSQYENISGRPEYDVAAVISNHAGQLTRLLKTIDGIIYDGSQSSSDQQLVHYSDNGVIASRTLSYWQSGEHSTTQPLQLEETTVRLWHEYDRWPHAERYRITTGWLVHQTNAVTAGLKTSFSFDISNQQPAHAWIEQVDPHDVSQTVGRQMTPYDVDQLQQILSTTTRVLQADHADTVLVNYLK